MSFVAAEPVLAGHLVEIERLAEIHAELSELGLEALVLEEQGAHHLLDLAPLPG
jgi:hypothetical protein